MKHKRNGVAVLIGFTLLGLPAAGADAKTSKPAASTVESSRSEAAILWREPTDIASRNLYFGPGGEQHQPHGPFTFVEEDLNGSNPKYIVRDKDKVKWTVKIGAEARPETVASRLVWSVGYFTNEDYFLPELHVIGMPAHVKRGADQIGPDGSIHFARLKRHVEELKKTENWTWRNDPLTGTRELNGLRVMMALINNWDLKDENNELYGGKGATEQVYMVSDLGASFGTTGLSFPFSRSKGNLDSFVHSKFITRISPEYVDFRTPSRPALIYAYWPPRFLRRVRLDDLGRHVPRADARWMGQVLSRLSADQIRDAFRAAGYTPDQVDAFSRVIQARIAQLSEL